MKNKILIYGVLGIIGAIGVGIGQFLMHYSSVDFQGDELFGFLKNIPQKNISIGHSLAVISLPFYFGGYWHIYLMLLPSHPQTAKWLYRFAICFLTIFAVWIGSQAILSIMVKGDFNNGLVHYVTYNQNLIWLVYLGFGLISIFFSYIVISGKTILPKWVAFCNPIILLGFLFLISWIIPSIGKIIMATPINIAHLVFFSITTYFIKKTKVSFPSNLDI